ncbi:saccharopine dehydrogenase NADP-binding domain-containing protein [Streptomyces sp. NPDC051776]|uniref:saccharopine dehydrogenase NADP-binding domain-containing protein n=1 Tax=Streptomyces sp. NPDC051776 TaxID=3155414 RepID=UPI00342E76D8
MSDRPVIGILGATGAVGRAAVCELRDLGYTELRLGGRRLDPLEQVLREELGGTGTAMRADLEDARSVVAFSESCSTVLNCAGPTYRWKAAAARAALEAGAPCVDVAGDDPAAEELTRERAAEDAGRAVVLSAGVMPGLSSILPRWLAAQELDTVAELTAYCGGLEPCTPTVAEDLMLSLTTGGAQGASYGEPLAAWRFGHRQPRALRADENTEAPGFAGRVALQPFLSTETERLATTLGLDRVDWFNVHPGPRSRAVMNLLPVMLAQGVDRPGPAARLMRDADLDLAGRSPYYVMDFTLTGTVAGARAHRRLSMRTTSSYRLTAVVGALAADAVVRGTVPTGVHFACDVLDPATVATYLVTSGAVSRFARSLPAPLPVGGTGHAEAALEEGSL